MAALDRPRLRPAAGADAGRIAALHADSWRRHYRGAYSDAFLDGEVDADRLAVWTQRLHAPDPWVRLEAEKCLAAIGGTLVVRGCLAPPEAS